MTHELSIIEYLLYILIGLTVPDLITYFFENLFYYDE